MSDENPMGGLPEIGRNKQGIRHANEPSSLTPAQGSADTIIRNLLKSSDCSWYEGNEGHDWREAVDAAERYLKGCPKNHPYESYVANTR